MLDALDAAGLRGDGRLLQLNSYENRVFQAMLEDGRAVVAKFYRPGRWSDAQILEEHDFARELAAAEVPVVPPLPLCAADPALHLQGAAGTLATWAAGDGTPYRFAVAERRAGREPELDDPAILAKYGPTMTSLGKRNYPKPFFDSSFTEKRLGYVPTPLDQGLAVTIDWMRRNKII